MQIGEIIHEYFFWFPFIFIGAWCILQIKSARRSGFLRNHQLTKIYKNENPGIFAATLSIYFALFFVCVIMIVASIGFIIVKLIK